MNKNSLLSALLMSLFVILTSLPGAAFGSGELTDLGTLPGSSNHSRANAISRFGNVVVGAGQDTSFNWRAFRWTKSGGMVDLGTLPSGGNSEAFAESEDGSVVVGTAYNSSGKERAFRWTQAGGMADLGILTGGTYSEGRGVSADGSIVVGVSDIPGPGGLYKAFRWTQAGGMTDMGALGGLFSKANGISADGAVIVGYAHNSGNARRAFRWTQSDNTMHDLGDLPLGDQYEATAVSADGQVVVGRYYYNSSYYRAFRWTLAGMVDIGDLGSGTWAEAYGVSGNGKVVVGYSWDTGNLRKAFRWTAATDMQYVKDWVGDVSSSVLYTAYGVSPDGQYVVGEDSFTHHAFMAVLKLTCGSTPVKIAETGSTYATIQSAYDHATTDQTIQMPVSDLTGDLNMQSISNIHVKLSGGYGCDFGANYGFSTLIGKLTINKGSAKVEYLVIR
jgi:probable HAF family extracellular repeat protein